MAYVRGFTNSERMSTRELNATRAPFQRRLVTHV